MSVRTKPKLILLLGRAGSGKTQIATEAFANAIRNSDRPLEDDLLFLLPTAEHRSRAIDLVLRRDVPGFFHNRISTFDRAIHEFLKVGGVDFASDVSRRAILRRLIRSMNLRYFTGIQDQEGSIELLSRFLIELKEFLIPLPEWKRHAELLQSRFPEFRGKYDELVQIYEAYETELKREDLVDQRDALRILEEGIRRGEIAPPDLKQVWIDGFSDFSKLQFAFIEFLTRHADEMTVTLTLDPDPFRAALFSVVSETRQRLEDMGFKPERLDSQNFRTKQDSLGHLERNLFRGMSVIAGSEIPRASLRACPPRILAGERSNLARSEQVPQSQSSEIATPHTGLAMTEWSESDVSAAIRIFEATGLMGEVEMIAREVKRLARVGGYYFSDMAILLRRADEYLPVIQSVFRRFQIPIEIHERFRLNATPLARALISFFRLLLDGWDRKDLLNFLKSSYLHQDPEQVAALELGALRKGIFKTRENWLKYFEFPVLKEIAEFENRFRTLDSAEDFARFTKGMIHHFGMFRFPDSSDEKTRLDRESAKRILLLLEELKKKVDTVIARSVALRQAQDGERSRTTTKQSQNSDLPAGQAGIATPAAQARNDAFLSIVEEFLALIQVDLFSLHWRDKNRVQIYNVSVARQKEYKAVFLAGLLEKEFPIQIKEDPILSDAERRALNEKGEVLKERLPRQAFERYLFYLAVTRAREHLILSYPRFNLEGKEALPSFYVDEVKALFPGVVPVKRQPITDLLPSWEDISERSEAEACFIKALWSAPEPKEKHSERLRPVFALYHYLAQEPAFRNVLSRLFRPIEGVIRDERIHPNFLPKRGIWSPTYIEEYAACPYRFYSDKVLGLKSQEEGIDIMRRGTILHDVLEHVFRWRHGEKKGEVNFEEARAFALQKFDELWNEKPLSGDRFYRIELERRNMQEMILNLLHLELVEEKPPIAGLIPRHFEYEFKNLLLHGERKQIPLRGKIDRIDIDSTGRYALVIDYKTGKPFSASSLENGTALQLPFYLMAVEEKLGLKPLGGHLYSLTAGNSTGFHHREHLAEAGVSTRKGRHLGGRDFEVQLQRAVRFAEKFTDEIEAGLIPVHPRDCVSYCPYSAICRIEKWRLKHLYRDIAEEDKKAGLRPVPERV